MVGGPTPEDGSRGGNAADDHRSPLPATPLVVLDASAPNAVEAAADRLLVGGIVSFPTDTVYAVAASLAHPAALDRIFAIKGRPATKPLPVLLAAATDLRRVALDLDDRTTVFLDRYWPGPLTVVVPAHGGLPDRVVGPHHTVGARVPDHLLAIDLITRAGGAVAATSANRTGAPPARDADEVAEALGNDVDLLLDGGRTPGGVPSTVVRLGRGSPIVLREGAIPGELLRTGWAAIVSGSEKG